LLVVCTLLFPVFARAQNTLAATAADNFSRANGSLGPNWTDISDGGLAIISKVAVTSTQLTGNQWIGPMVRAQNGGRGTR
jgi:hypothetical protein